MPAAAHDVGAAAGVPHRGDRLRAQVPARPRSLPRGGPAAGGRAGTLPALGKQMCHFKCSNMHKVSCFGSRVWMVCSRGFHGWHNTEGTL